MMAGQASEPPGAAATVPRYGAAYPMAAATASEGRAGRSSGSDQTDRSRIVSTADVPQLVKQLAKALLRASSGAGMA